MAPPSAARGSTCRASASPRSDARQPGHRRVTSEVQPARKRYRLLGLVGFAVAGGLVAARNFIALNSVPPGLYIDEASVGYNAWTIAHDGVDEHGAHLPLFFEAFGEYKNPVYIYALAPLARFLPLSAAVVRFPAALFATLTVLLLTLAA